MNEINNWLENEVYPRIVENANNIFSEHNFTKRGRVWQSPTYLNGEKHQRADKTYISENAPYCISEQGGESISFYNYIKSRENLDDSETIKRLGELVGVKPPNSEGFNSEGYSSQLRKSSLLETLNNYFVFLLDESKTDAINYLKRRGYSLEEIKNIGFGYVPERNNVEAKLKNYNFNKEEIDSVNTSLVHKISIPFRDPTGKIIGFVYRAIDSNTTPKYLYSKGLERGAYFFNFNKSKNEETLIVVEGIIDALLLTQREMRGAVACGGDSPTESQINNALKYGKVKNVILCLDNDDAGRKGTERAIELLKGKNINIYVANTDPYKDPDELIKNKSIEDFKGVLKSAESWVKWTAKRNINKYDTTTDIGREGALNDLLKLENDITDPIESEYVIETIAETLGYSREVIADKILTFHEKRAKEKQAESYKELLKEAQKLERENKFEELGNFLNDGIAKTRAIIVSNIVTPYPTEKAIEDIQNRRVGLETGYPSIDKFVSIPNGAMTLIAGRPSHCKTTFLLNLMLNMVEQNPEKSFYFFSYEESKTALYVKIINILSETIVSKGLEYKNSQQLEYYIKGGSRDNSSINNSISLYDKYIKEGRLWLIDTPLPVDILAGTLENTTFNYDVGGVFIDYAQRVKYSGKYETERVKIARISETLRETSTRLDLPLIVGTQLNRENSKDKPQLDNLKEAGNLEEDANVVLGLYNWKTAIEKEKANEMTTKDGETKKKTLKNCKGGDIKIDVRAIDFEVHILKNRNGAINETALLSFDAPILKIKDTEKKTEESPF